MGKAQEDEATMTKNLLDASFEPVDEILDDDLIYVARSTPEPQDSVLSGAAFKAFFPSRREVPYETNPIGDAVTVEDEVALGNSFVFNRVSLNRGAWVRVYESNEAMVADASRLIGVDPALDAGVLLEVSLGSAGVVPIVPNVFGMKSSPTSDKLVPVRVTNRSGEAGIVEVVFDIMEVS